MQWRLGVGKDDSVKRLKMWSINLSWKDFQEQNGKLLEWGKEGEKIGWEG